MVQFCTTVPKFGRYRVRRTDMKWGGGWVQVIISYFRNGGSVHITFCISLYKWNYVQKNNYTIVSKMPVLPYSEYEIVFSFVHMNMIPKIWQTAIYYRKWWFDGIKKTRPQLLSCIECCTCSTDFCTGSRRFCTSSRSFVQVNGSIADAREDLCRLWKLCIDLS